MAESHSQEYDLVEHDDYWVVPLTGKPVSRFIIGYGLTLEFLDPEEEMTIVIENNFRLCVDETEYDLFPDEPKALGPVLGLLYRTVKSGLAYKDGTLVVEFAEGRENSRFVGPKL
jgi:hypothetical protein